LYFELAVGKHVFILLSINLPEPLFSVVIRNNFLLFDFGVRNFGAGFVSQMIVATALIVGLARAAHLFLLFLDIGSRHVPNFVEL